VADITILRTLDRSFHVFLCNDIHTNRVVAHLIRSTSIDSKAIVNVLDKALNKRFIVVPKIKLIKGFFMKFRDKELEEIISEE
jgi:hypothetical protein